MPTFTIKKQIDPDKWEEVAKKMQETVRLEAAQLVADMAMGVDIPVGVDVDKPFEAYFGHIAKGLKIEFAYDSNESTAEKVE